MNGIGLGLAKLPPQGSVSSLAVLLLVINTYMTEQLSLSPGSEATETKFAVASI